MKIAFFAKAPDATEYYRVKIPAKFLERAGHQTKISYAEKFANIPNAGVKMEDVAWADIVLFQRPVTPVVLGTIELIRKNFPQKPIVADYDDDYYSVPRWNPGYPHVKIHEQSWQKMVGMFDGIIASTDTLKDVLKSKVKKDVEVVTIGNAIDFDMLDSLEPYPPVEILAPAIAGPGKIAPAYTLDTNQFNEFAKDRIVCCWAGSKFHYVDLDSLPSELKKVCEVNDDIIFLFVSYLQQHIVESTPINRLFTSKGVAPISDFYRFLSTIKIDIMLAPLDPCPFNQSKSNLKILEALACCKAYPICSALDPYEVDLDPELNEDTVHGTLAGYEAGDWVKAILDANEKIKDPIYRKTFKTENDAYVRSTYDAELRTEKYEQFFQRMIEKKVT